MKLIYSPLKILKNVCDIELSDEEIAAVGPEIASSPVKISKAKLKEEAGLNIIFLMIIKTMLFNFHNRKYS